MTQTYQPVSVDVPEQCGAVTAGGRVEVEEERVHAVRRQAQAPEVVPHGQLHGRRVHLLGGVPTHCKKDTTGRVGRVDRVSSDPLQKGHHQRVGRVTESVATHWKDTRRRVDRVYRVI